MLVKTASLDSACGWAVANTHVQVVRRDGVQKCVPLKQMTPTSRASSRARGIPMCCVATDEDLWEGELVKLDSGDRLRSGQGAQNWQLGMFLEKVKENELNLFPDYQRDYVWKEQTASRLIVTALCNRMIPQVLLHERARGKYDCVDGKQRLCTLLGFMLNGQKRYIGPGRPPKWRERFDAVLPRLEYLQKLSDDYENLNGISFLGLSEDRRRMFKNFQITVSIIPYGTPMQEVFDVYNDINSGGEKMNEQQVRRAFFYGPYIRMLDEVANTCTDFHAIRDPTAVENRTYKPCRKEADRQLILRALAFTESGTQKRDMRLHQLMNEELIGFTDEELEGKNDKQKADQLIRKRSDFEKVMEISRNVFGRHAFRRWKKLRGGEYEWETSVNLLLWDAGVAAMIDLIRLYKSAQFTAAKSSMIQGIQKSYENEALGDLDGKRRTAFFIARRDEFKRIVNDAISNSTPPLDPIRSFSSISDTSANRPVFVRKLSESQNGLCGICKQFMDEARFNEPGYVHIDHIIPHSKGGPTNAENAQLVHAECNLAKGAKSGDD
ncbi:hypothetical protein FVE85_2883 [Porphyridium purpureum]|uniref:HNH nuclease domain-containing protein n=1 Tax=Porphyridium purpureum TaxID=35688 RepID=A0A5J4YUX6_PORPP|nr:hypothetical protein FVE85_2883 [Porphyridium purpureum]|eukprot:POR9682..scf227_4